MNVRDTLAGPFVHWLIQQAFPLPSLCRALCRLLAGPQRGQGSPQLICHDQIALERPFNGLLPVRDLIPSLFTVPSPPIVSWHCSSPRTGCVLGVSAHPPFLEDKLCPSSGQDFVPLIFAHTHAALVSALSTLWCRPCTCMSPLLDCELSQGGGCVYLACCCLSKAQHLASAY